MSVANVDALLESKFGKVNLDHIKGVVVNDVLFESIKQSSCFTPLPTLTDEIRQGVYGPYVAGHYKNIIVICGPVGISQTDFWMIYKDGYRGSHYWGDRDEVES